MNHKKNNVVFGLLFICLFACNNKESRKLQDRPKNVDLNMPLKIELDSLAKTLNPDTLNIVINKTDSILRDRKNENDGYYFHLRGFCFTALEQPEKAIFNLKKAQMLGYLPSKCQQLIDFNEALLNIKKKYN